MHHPPISGRMGHGNSGGYDCSTPGTAALSKTSVFLTSLHHLDLLGTSA